MPHRRPGQHCRHSIQRDLQVDHIVSSQAIEHDQVEAVLSLLGSSLAASEAHGVLCGLLCTGHRGRTSDQVKGSWFRELLEGAGLSAADVAAHAEGFKLLDGLYESTVDGLNSAELEFRLLLPAETISVDLRFGGLSSWCSGFCLGFGLNSGNRPKPTADVQQSDTDASLPPDTRELLEDFGNIAAGSSAHDHQVDVSLDHSADTDDASGEEDEQALAELEEYVRVGTLLISEEMSPVVAPAPTLH